MDKKEELINWSKKNYVRNKKSDKVRELIYINEHLTKYNKILLRKARMSDKIKYAWFRSGSVSIKREDDSEIEKISINQIEEASISEGQSEDDENNEEAAPNDAELGNKKHTSLGKYLAAKEGRFNQKSIKRRRNKDTIRLGWKEKY